jgi:hypothetical protein
VRDDIIHGQHAAGQKVGTGYAGSHRVLLREIRRGVDWVFSNHAGRMQRILKEIQS